MAEQTDQDNTKKRLAQVGIVAILLIIALALWFFLGRDSAEEPEGDEVDIIETQPGPTAAPGDGPTEGELPDGVSPPGDNVPIEDRAPTTPRSPDGIEDAYEGDFHADPTDPAQGTPDFLSENLVRNLFTTDVRMDTSYEQNFDRFGWLMTDRMRAEGFKKWWVGDDHNLAWEVASEPTYNSRLNAFPSLASERWVSEDIIEYDYDVGQRITQRIGYSNLPDFRIMVYMKYVDGKWLMDNYVIPDGYAPNMH